MATGFIEIQGAAELQQKLDVLPRKVATKLERKGTRLGTKVFADEIKSRAPVDTGLLKGAITVRALKRKQGRIGFRVTINTKGRGGRTKAAKAKREAGGFFTKSEKTGKVYFYPAVVEYGSQHHSAQAPMRRGFDTKKDEALAKVVASIKEGIRDATHK